MEPQEKKGFFRGLIDKISGVESAETSLVSPGTSAPETAPVQEPTVQETQAEVRSEEDQGWSGGAHRCPGAGQKDDRCRYA